MSRRFGQRVVGLVVAGGSGERLGAPVPKAFVFVGGSSLLERSSRCLLESGFLSDLVVVVPAGAGEEVMQPALQAVRQASSQSGVRFHDPVRGGERRQDSARLGLAAALSYLGDEAAGSVVFIHDAARPFMPRAVFERLLAAADALAAERSDLWGVVPALSVADTLRVVGDAGGRAPLPQRESIVAVQTPQVFPLPVILDAHERAVRENVTASDDAGLLEWAGGQITIVEGSVLGFKVTTREDLVMAKVIAAGGESAGGIRIGAGYDVHRLVAGRKLILGGVEIEHDRGLLGHSDADALTHALIDALLGASGLGDIGQLFPDTDPAWKDASSLEMLAKVVSLLSERGLAVTNVDATVVAEAPRLAPYVPRIRERLASVLGLDSSRVSVKAKTAEGLGPEGVGEAISVHAVALLAPSPAATEAVGAQGA